MNQCHMHRSDRRVIIKILFITNAFFALLTTLFAQEYHLTARQVIERIQKNVGIPWLEQTIDTFKAGNPDTPVTGIATTMFATLDVLQRAVDSGANLIIVHEPTFYNHYEDVSELEEANDAVLAVKKAFIDEHGLVIWRFHDHWHMRNPDGIVYGMIRALGLEKYEDQNTDNLFVVPETTLKILAAEIKKRMGMQSLRVVGNPDMNLTRLAFVPGAPSANMQIQALQREEVEVLLIGEAREWETVEYARDAVIAGMEKALIILGHVVYEEAGMEECARWLKTFVTEVPVEFIPSTEPFWTPE
ncbi:Nif3-like dinuclear metal center hexameric protein [bacterium]|nr:Nif3-like dinuclear metal center hexameric protein [bacterium]